MTARQAQRVEPIARPGSFTEITLVAVRELILNGHYQPGDRINEVELANSLGVSRGPLREALQHLSNERLVDRVQNHGTFIPKFSASDTLEFYELREALEVMASRLAAERAKPADLSALRSVLDSTIARLEASNQAHYPSDLDFHDQLISIAGNRQLEQRFREVHNQLHLTRARSAYSPERARQAYSEHLEIFRALEIGDPDLADQAMRAHMRMGLTHVRQLFKINSTDQAPMSIVPAV